MEKLLLIGCHGLLGQNLANRAVAAYQVTGIDLQPRTFLDYDNFDYFAGDITDRGLVERIRVLAPDAIVNCAAWTAVDRAETEKEACWRVNCEGVRNLIRAAQLTRARLVQLSTDYIFDGTAGPYTEDAEPNPQSVYARSKLAAENLVRGSGIAFTIVRTIVLYGKGVDLQKDFVTWLLEELRENRPVRIVADQIGNVTYAPELAAAILQALQLRLDGILHVGSSDMMSRLEFARLVASQFDLDQELIRPIATAELRQPAPRPLQGGLAVAESQQRLQMKFNTAVASLAVYKRENPHTHRLN